MGLFYIAQDKWVIVFKGFIKLCLKRFALNYFIMKMSVSCFILNDIIHNIFGILIDLKIYYKTLFYKMT